MTASRVAYAAFVAFVSVVATLVVVALVGDEETSVAPPTKEMETVPQRFTMEEVREHDHAGSCWKVIEGVVYDLTDYLPRHPTDEEAFVRWCGREATEAWRDTGDGRPHSARAESMLRGYRIGTLEQGDPH